MASDTEIAAAAAPEPAAVHAAPEPQDQEPRGTIIYPRGVLGPDGRMVLMPLSEQLPGTVMPDGF